VPWSEKSVMSQRHEFVMLFEQEGVNRRELCRRFGVSPTIGYRLLARWRTAGKAGLADRSRRPQHSPGRRSAAMEGLVLAVRDAHPAWGGRKIRRRLQDLKHLRFRFFGREAVETFFWRRWSCRKFCWERHCTCSMRGLPSRHRSGHCSAATW
jgi:transposase-like protein